jgi:hypothetical protein
MSKSALTQVQDLGWYVRDMNNDGFTQFEAKKKLYLILWETQRQLEKAPQFVGETEWLQEQRLDSVV